MAHEPKAGQRLARLPGGAHGLVAVLLALTAACRAPPPARGPGGGPARPAGATEYRLDAEGSQLPLYPHAAGPMGKLGPSPVISTHRPPRPVWLPAPPPRSARELP